MTPFADTGNKTSKSPIKRTEFFDLSQGQHMIRILDESATRIDTHWINNSSIRCLGEDCPVCKDNFIILHENPKNYRDIKGWNPPRKTYFVNVLDKTPVKICPSCQAEIKKNNSVYPSTCPKCNTMLPANVHEQPLNKVKMLSRGVQLFEYLNAMVKSVLDEAGNIKPINTYDVILTVSGIDKDKKVFPMPLPMNSEPVSISQEELYDTENAVVTLTPEEIKELQRGVRIKDIFLARKAEVESEGVEVAESSKKGVEDKIKSLFADG